MQALLSGLLPHFLFDKGKERDGFVFLRNRAPFLALPEKDLQVGRLSRDRAMTEESTLTPPRSISLEKKRRYSMLRRRILNAGKFERNAVLFHKEYEKLACVAFFLPHSFSKFKLVLHERTRKQKTP